MSSQTDRIHTPTVELSQLMLLQILGHKGNLAHFEKEAVKNFLPSVLAMLVGLVTSSWTTCSGYELLPSLLGLPKHLRNLSFFPVQQSEGQKFTMSVSRSMSERSVTLMEFPLLRLISTPQKDSSDLWCPAVPPLVSMMSWIKHTTWERVPQRLLNTWIKLWHPLWLARNWML